MTEPAIPKRFAFRFALPCRFRQPLLDDEIGLWAETYRLPPLAELEGPTRWVDAYAGWNPQGLALAFHVWGKHQPPCCTPHEPDESDGVDVWIDTRAVHNVHRATRFCHRFLLLPAGGGPRGRDPLARWLPIHRARQQPPAIRWETVHVRSQVRPDGYLLEAAFPRDALAGFDPEDHPRLGFNYAVTDRELGIQTLTAGDPLPYQEDPSVWATLDLVP